MAVRERRVANVVRVSCGVKGVDPAPPRGSRMASGKAVVTGRATNPLRVSSHLRGTLLRLTLMFGSLTRDYGSAQMF